MALARKDAAKKLVKYFDSTTSLFGATHPEKIQNPLWNMPIGMPYEEWKEIVDAFRPLAED